MRYYGDGDFSLISILARFTTIGSFTSSYDAMILAWVTLRFNPLVLSLYESLTDGLFRNTLVSVSLRFSSIFSLDLDNSFAGSSFYSYRLDSGNLAIFFFKFSLQAEASVHRSYFTSSLTSTSCYNFFWMPSAIMNEFGNTLETRLRINKLHRAFIYILSVFSKQWESWIANLLPKFSTIFSVKSSKLIH